MSVGLKNSWPLFLGMLMLMIGNGLQGTLLGVRGGIEGFSPDVMSLVMAGYYIGILGGSKLAPLMINRVGHVRVFAALASLISACFILFPAFPSEFIWFILRVIVGFCFSGVYVVSESWLNDISTNTNRGKILSFYLIIQTLGIVLAQILLNFADPNGYSLFIIASVVLSLSFTPILLSVAPAPPFDTTKPMGLSKLYKTSPLGVVGLFLLGAIFGALFGMTAIFGTERGMSVSQISIFVAIIYLGGMLFQMPIGWLSDRMDRRYLIIILSSIGAFFSILLLIISYNFMIYLFVAFIIGGMSNPLYSLFIAYTNDFLDHDDMAAAAGGLVFINGLGAIIGPVMVGMLMSKFGPDSFFAYLGVILILTTVYALYRNTQRVAPSVEETYSYTPITPSSSPVAVEVAQEIAIEAAIDELDEEFS
jgi:MFS family permease